jgi:hypothetical protein
MQRWTGRYAGGYFGCSFGKCYRADRTGYSSVEITRELLQLYGMNAINGWQILLRKTIHIPGLSVYQKLDQPCRRCDLTAI